MQESKLSQDERNRNHNFSEPGHSPQPPNPQLAGHIWLLAFMFLVLITVVLLTWEAGNLDGVPGYYTTSAKVPTATILKY